MFMCIYVWEDIYGNLSNTRKVSGQYVEHPHESGNQFLRLTPYNSKT